METDCTLLNAARMMDKPALVKIFDLYSAALYKYALRLCSDPVRADHIVGDVFAKLLDQLAAGKGPEDNLRSYLFESTYHRIIDEARAARHSVSLEVVSWLRQEAKPLPLVWEEHDLLKQVMYALQHKLSEDQRHVIFLRFFEEFSVRETATILGKREDHVRVIQNRGIKVLRRIFRASGKNKDVSISSIMSMSKALGD
jgi:RNA polymerase sigma-70 factor, ECF subfamily